MSTSQNEKNGPDKPPEKPNDQELFLGFVDSRTENPVRQEEKKESPSPTAKPELSVPVAPGEPQQLAKPVEQNIPVSQNTAPPVGGNGNGSAMVPSPPQWPDNIPKDTPTRLEAILDMVGEGKTIWDALVSVFGLHEPNYKYLILERTRLSKREANLVSDALFVAEHGIGIGCLDFPMPEFADWVLNRCHAFVSVDMGKGNSRDEFREIASSYVAALKAKAAAMNAGTGVLDTDRGLTSGPP